MFTSTILCSLILASYLFINTNDALITLVILTVLYGIGYGAPFTLTRALMADIVDADELKSKKKRLTKKVQAISSEVFLAKVT